MHLYKTSSGNILVTESGMYRIDMDWDELINRDDLHVYLDQYSKGADAIQNTNSDESLSKGLLPPIGTQEVWAAGVTYLRSRDARMEESQDSGAADCYQRVYEAERPEIFFKSAPYRVVGHDQEVFIRKDSEWDVPEPELALFINSKGIIQGYTIGNDMSSRSIEGENPLYLPQAKIYDKSAALGPCLYVPRSPIPQDTEISLRISRNNEIMFSASTTLKQMKRGLEELAGYLYQELSFPTGAFLMTGTCLVPSNDFTLQRGDVVEITIQHIGMMRNIVSMSS